MVRRFKMLSVLLLNVLATWHLNALSIEKLFHAFAAFYFESKSEKKKTFQKLLDVKFSSLKKLHVNRCAIVSYGLAAIRFIFSGRKYILLEAL